MARQLGCYGNLTRHRQRHVAEEILTNSGSKGIIARCPTPL